MPRSRICEINIAVWNAEREAGVINNRNSINPDRETRVISHLIFVLGRIKASNVIKFCINYKSLNGLGGLFMGNWDRVDEPIRYSNPIQR